MEIQQVKQKLLITSRLKGMGHLPVKVLQNLAGSTSVALDPIGVEVGDWVFTIANSSARSATGDNSIITDLTVGGIIDNWPLKTN